MSIEDLGHSDGDPIYPLALALERVEAAAEAARRHDIVPTARSEGLLTGTLTLAQVCARIEAFSRAGADVVFAPGLSSAEDVQAVVAVARDTPVSVLVGGPNADLTVPKLAGMGVARISVGSALARVAYGSALSVIRAALTEGQFAYPDTTASFAEISTLLGAKP